MPPAIRNSAFLFCGCLVFHLAGTWSLPLIDRDEPRFAEAAREMRERHDFVIPYFNNQFRFDKPPLTYWFQVASYRLFGENDFAARFPTTIATALVAVVLFAWGARLRDERVGWWAAIIFTLSLQTFIHGKAAVADMWLVLFVTLAHWSAWELTRGETSNIEDRRFNIQCWGIFYISLALAFLAKGPIGWTPLLTLVAMKITHPGLRLNKRFRFIPGMALMLGIVCAWGIPALVRTRGEFFWIGIGKHVVERTVATMEGHGASSFWMYLALLPFYFITVFVSFFPWSIKLPVLWKSVRSNRDITDDFLLAGTLIVFGVFTLVRTKLPHYTLPAFPLLAMLVARRFEFLKLSRSLAIAAAGIYFAIAICATPFLATFFPAYSLARDSRLDLKPEMEFGAVDFTEPSLVWYFRNTIRGFMTPLKRKEAAEFMNEEGARFIVLPTKSVSEIFPNVDASWRSYHAKGFNLAKGQRVDLTMLLKTE